MRVRSFIEGHLLDPMSLTLIKALVWNFLPKTEGQMMTFLPLQNGIVSIVIVNESRGISSEF